MLNGTGEVTPGDFVIEDVVPDSGEGALSAPVTLHDALRMEWDYFECLVAAIWQKRGYKTVYLTPHHDDGVDVVAITGSIGVLLQCKSRGADGAALSWDAVKEVVAGEAAYRLRHPGIAFQKACITNQFFNSTARRHTELNNVELLGQRPRRADRRRLTRSWSHCSPRRRDGSTTWCKGEPFRSGISHGGTSVMRARSAGLCRWHSSRRPSSRAIFEGRQPVELTPHQLKRQALPYGWDDQQRLLGFQP